MLDALRAAWEQAVAAGDVHALILASADPRRFCAGADIRGFTALPAGDGRARSEQTHAWLLELERSPIVTIAAVGAAALGGGCELAMACDVRIAGESASFGQPEIALGIIPGFGGTQRLPRLVGVSKALEMNLLGTPITAQEAWEFGLVNRVVPDHELFDTALAWARELAARAPLAVAQIKRVSGAGELEQGIAAERDAFAEVLASEDAQRGNRGIPRQAPAALHRPLTRAGIVYASESMSVETGKDSGVRARVTARGEEALGKLVQDLLENPVLNACADARVRGSRQGGGRPGGDDGLPRHPLRRRHGAPHAPTAFGIPAARVDRGCAGASRGGDRARPRALRSLERIEERLAELGRLLGELRGDAPAPVSPDQERLRVEGGSRRPRRGSRRRARGRCGQRAATLTHRNRAGPRAQLASNAAAPRRPTASPAASSARCIDPRALAAQQVGDGERAADGDAAQRAEREQRRGLHLDRERALLAPAREARLGRARRTGRSRRSCRCAPARAAAARSDAVSGRVGVDPLARAERPARAVGADRLARRSSRLAPARAPRRARRRCRRGSRASTPSAISSSSTIAAEGPPMPGALDRQRLAVGGDARVAPEAAVVVEHARLREQLWRERERAAGVAGQQHARRERRRRVQVDGGRRVGQSGDYRGLRTLSAMARRCSRRCASARGARRALGAPSRRARLRRPRLGLPARRARRHLRAPARSSRCTSTTACAARSPTATSAHVRELCERSASRCVVRAAPPPPARGNLQAWARDLRYARALEHAARRADRDRPHRVRPGRDGALPPRRLARAGARCWGWRRARGGWCARCSALTREQTAAYCRERGLSWREDSSNDGPIASRADACATGVLARAARACTRPPRRTCVRTRRDPARRGRRCSTRSSAVALAGRARIALERLAAAAARARAAAS